LRLEGEELGERRVRVRRFVPALLAAALLMAVAFSFTVALVPRRPTPILGAASVTVRASLRWSGFTAFSPGVRLLNVRRLAPSTVLPGSVFGLRTRSAGGALVSSPMRVPTLIMLAMQPPDLDQLRRARRFRRSG
jgi:hypothetical protein